MPALRAPRSCNSIFPPSLPRHGTATMYLVKASGTVLVAPMPGSMCVPRTTGQAPVSRDSKPRPCRYQTVIWYLWCALCLGQRMRVFLLHFFIKISSKLGREPRRCESRGSFSYTQTKPKIKPDANPPGSMTCASNMTIQPITNHPHVSDWLAPDASTGPAALARK